MIIIGGPHQGFKTDRIFVVGDSISLQDSRYTVRKFKTGNPNDDIFYAAPLHWNNAQCFEHLLSLVSK